MERKPFSIEHKEKIREKIKQLWQNPEYRKKMVESHLGYKMREETKKKLSLLSIGKKKIPMLEKQKKKLSKIKKGKPIIKNRGKNH